MMVVKMTLMTMVIMMMVVRMIMLVVLVMAAMQREMIKTKTLPTRVVKISLTMKVTVITNVAIKRMITKRRR